MTLTNQMNSEKNPPLTPPTTQACSSPSTCCYTAQHLRILHFVTSLRHGLCCHSATGGYASVAQSRTMGAAHRSTRTSQQVAYRHPQKASDCPSRQPLKSFLPFSLASLSLLQVAAVDVFLCLQPTRGQLQSSPGPTSSSIWSTVTQAELDGHTSRCCQNAVKHRHVQQQNELKSHSKKVTHNTECLLTDHQEIERSCDRSTTLIAFYGTRQVNSSKTTVHCLPE